MKISILLFLTFFLSATRQIAAQNSALIVDGRDTQECSACESLVKQMPKEVLFGVHISENGDVYFSMNNINWFKKVFQNDNYGVSVDIVSEDRYQCNTLQSPNQRVPKGVLMRPVLRKDLLSKNESTENAIRAKIGSIPANLMNKKIEGNLVIINGSKICDYTTFVNISRVGLELLPMGLFADTLVNASYFSREPFDSLGLGIFTYSIKKQITIPFKKATSVYDQVALKKAYDSLKLERYRIQKIEIRAYSSVEGSESINMELMRQRGDAMIKLLKPHQAALKRSNVLTAENWVDFFSDIAGTEFQYLKDFSKVEIKRKLTDSELARRIEPLLSRERKTVATLYLEPKTLQPKSNELTFETVFKNAIKNRQLEVASAIQKEVIEKIADNKLPFNYIEKLEVPQTKDFCSLLNDREVYKYLFMLTFEEEALDNFQRIKTIDPNNAHVNYNICALKLTVSKVNYDSLLPSSLSDDINQLANLGIHKSLVGRMLVNFNILKCESLMRQFDYEGKDVAIQVVRDAYDSLQLSDEEIYSLARYFSYYSHNEWALEIINPRVEAIDVSEDLIFYYINLLFYNPSVYDSENFKKASLNCINLNKLRYCHFFLPHDKGGASMQLLDNLSIRSLWCQNCK
jgi:hypothetical protein